MNRPRVLTLPHRPRQLWLSTRDIVRQSLDAVAGRPVDYRIGGGTILAARWMHRTSFDIDLVVEENFPLRELQNPAGSFRRRMEALGGELKFYPDLKLCIVLFSAHESKLDLWAHTPRPSEGHELRSIDGRREAVLSTTQILRGKLQRATDNLVRDIYDIVQAQAFDPDSLEAAVNAIAPETATAMAHRWYWNSPSIALRVDEELQGAPPESVGDPNRLGWRAATVITDALYCYLQISAEPGEAVVDTRTGAGRRRSLRIAGQRIDEEFESRGLNEHLDSAGPGADAVRRELHRQCAQHGPPRTVFREQDHETTLWRAQPDPTRDNRNAGGPHEFRGGAPQRAAPSASRRTGSPQLDPTRQHNGPTR